MAALAAAAITPAASVPRGPRTAVRITVLAIWRTDRTIELFARKLLTLWKKLENHEKPEGSVKASGSLPT